MNPTKNRKDARLDMMCKITNENVAISNIDRTIIVFLRTI